MRRTTPTLLALLLLALIGWGFHSGRLRVPEAWNPWAPLRIDAAPNWLTRYKLARASSDRAACRAALAQADMVLVPLDDRVTGEGCGFANAVRIERTSVAVGEPFSLSCRAALSLAMWERHDLQRAALAHLGRRVRRIEHFGSYACRNLYGETGRRRSQHATADALDIAGFVLEDGRRVRVVSEWVSHARPKSGTTSDGSPDASGQSVRTGPDGGSVTTVRNAPESRFLHAARDGACHWFDAVLGPDYNRAHADHFHFDRGRARICR